MFTRVDDRYNQNGFIVIMRLICNIIIHDAKSINKLVDCKHNVLVGNDY